MRNNYLNNNFGFWAAMSGCLTPLLFSFGFIFLVAWLAQWLWNTIVVVKFCAPYLTYWEMFGLMVMVRLFFPVINFNRSSSK